MDTKIIEKRFEEMGARVKFRTLKGPDFLTIDISKDKKGEFFQINSNGDQQVEVVNIDIKDRHLLLLHRKQSVLNQLTGRKILELSKFLCGHDETQWFVAAVPESARGVTNVITAKQALKPKDIIEVEGKAGLTKHKKAAHLHRNTARIRQGEWFFIPAPKKEFKEIEILHNEPIRRGRGNPHICEELVRYGGITVMVSRQYPNGITVGEFDRLIKTDKKAKHMRWDRMTRDMKVFVRGRIKHRQHPTRVLKVWHQVIPNEETKARAMRNLAFLD